MAEIKLNAQTSINLEALLVSRLLIQANSGGGKSWLIRRLLEQSHGKVQQIVIDAEGEFSTLRAKYDYVLAGKDGDTPADPRSAALLARRLLELRVSAIIDIYELSNQDKKRFVRLFLEALVNASKDLWPINYAGCMVVIDEAHRFAPEKGESEALGAVESLASLGRKRGLCAVLATQRISKLHKDAAAECNNKLIGRSSLDLDRKRSAEELGFSSKVQVLSLRTLSPGHFYAFGPAISDQVIQIQVGEVQTAHTTTKQQKLVKIPPTSKIKALLPKLSDLPKEAQQEAVTISGLQQQVRGLTAENRKLQRNQGVTKFAVPDENATAHMVAKRVSVIERIYKTRDIEHRKLLASMTKHLKQMNKEIDNAAAKAFNPAEAGAESYRATLPKPINVRQNETLRLKTVVNVMDGRATVDGDILISGPEQRILDAIATMEAIGVSSPAKEAVAFIAKYRPSSGGYNNLLSKLRTKGFISYPAPGQIALTDAARDHVETKGPVSTEDLHAMLLDFLSVPEQKLMRPIIEAYPDDLSNEELAEKSGYIATSGGFNNLKSRLRTFGLIDYPIPGRVIATKILFPS